MEVGKLMASLDLEMSGFKNQLANAQKNLESMGSKMKDLGGKMSLGLTAPLMAGVGLITEGTKEFAGDLARLQTNATMAGADMGQMSAAMAELEGVTGETDSNVEGLSNILASGFKGDKFQSVMEGLAGAAIKFSDTLKFEGVADGLQETLATGAAIGPFAELLDRSGISLDTFNAGLKEATANGTQEQYVLDTLAKAGLPAVYEQYKKNNGAMMDNAAAHFELNQAMAEMSTTLMPLVTQALSGITQLAQGFNSLGEGTKTFLLVFGGIAAAIGPVMGIVGNLMTAVKLLGPAFTFITGPIGLCIVAFAALVAAGVLLYKHWDEVKAKATQIWNAIKDSITKTVDNTKQACITAWERAKADMSQKWNNIKQTASQIWDSLKQYFTQWGPAVLVALTGPVGMTVAMLAKNWNTIKSTALTTWNGIKSGIMGVWSGISSGVSGAASTLVSTVKTKLESAWSYIKSIPSQATGWGRSIIQGLANGIRSIHIPMPHISMSLSSKSIGGVSIPMPNFSVNWYDKGGIFNNPAIIGVGEKRPEFVGALDDLRKIVREESGNGGPIQLIVNLDGRVISNQLYNLERSQFRGGGKRG